MACADLHVNVQDAAGDRILAGEMLKKDDTRWDKWIAKKGVVGLHEGGGRREKEEEEDTHVGHVLGHGRERKKFPKSPKLHKGEQPDACRIYGSLEGNKVQGDFHITARGHGYMEMGQHLDHASKWSNALLSESCTSKAVSMLGVSASSLF